MRCAVWCNKLKPSSGTEGTAKAQKKHRRSRGVKRDLIFILDIMRVGTYPYDYVARYRMRFAVCDISFRFSCNVFLFVLSRRSIENPRVIFILPRVNELNRNQCVCACSFVFSRVIICVAIPEPNVHLPTHPAINVRVVVGVEKQELLLLLLFTSDEMKREKKKITKKENRSKRPPRRCVCEEMTEPRYILKYFYYYFIFVSRFSIFLFSFFFIFSVVGRCDPYVRARCNPVRTPNGLPQRRWKYMHIHIVINNVD